MKNKNQFKWSIQLSNSVYQAFKDKKYNYSLIFGNLKKIWEDIWDFKIQMKKLLKALKEQLLDILIIKRTGLIVNYLKLKTFMITFQLNINI